jgi:hypothetical protein
MIEFLRHITGLCGEHWHPNFITLLAGSPALLACFYYIRASYLSLFLKKKTVKKVVVPENNSYI